MKKNMGFVDRYVRLAMAFAIIILYLSGVIPGTLGIVLIVLSVIIVLTSLVGFCPLYFPFGITTLRRNHSRQQ